MTEAQVISVMRRHIETQFPKTCSMCGLVFPTLAAYLRTVKHVGAPISYDVAIGNWEPLEPIGAVSMANCCCGTTLCVTSRGMSRWNILRLLRWARAETRRRGIDMRQLLAYLRAKGEAEVLAEAVEQRTAG